MHALVGTLLWNKQTKPKKKEKSNMKNNKAKLPLS